MSVKCREIMDYMEELAPLRLAEKWDNAGLLLGDSGQEIKKVQVCLDVTARAVEEAVAKGVDMMISHHPLIFEGLKKIVCDNAGGRVVYALIRNNIGVYCAHTNLDAARGGVNDWLAQVLGLSQIRNVRSHYVEKLYKLVVFVPEDSTDKVRDAMSVAGAGHIGSYSECTFSARGTGTFRPLEDTHPYIGTQGKLEKTTEYRMETIVPAGSLKAVINAMLKAHPYEEAAYDIYELEHPRTEYGFGKVGVLEKPLPLTRFIDHVKSRLGTAEIRLIGSVDRPIQRVAVFSGAFDGDFSCFTREQADVLVTGDVKYHTALDAVENGMCMIDAGHFSTERVIVPRLAHLLSQRFPSLEVISHIVGKSPFNHC